MKLLKALEIKDPPFRERPRTNERPHWVKPSLVAQIKFTEWTADGKLRHPVYLGLRDDKKPADDRSGNKSAAARRVLSGFRVQGSGFRVRFKVQRFAFKVRFKVQQVRFNVPFARTVNRLNLLNRLNPLNRTLNLLNP